MWAKELFNAFIENDTAKEKELSKNLPLTNKISLQSIKSFYKNHRTQGMTPFVAAILHNDMALCEQLIEEGIDFGQQGCAANFDEQTFIQFNNDASKLIALDVKSNVFKDFTKTTPMFWAIKCEKLLLIEKLIRSGHKMNALVEKLAGMPALSFAILSRNIPVVKYFLINHTCDVHEKSLPDMKPLDVAIRSGNQDMVRVILEHGENPDCGSHQLSPLLQAVFLNNIKMVKFILRMGANINFGVENGNFFPPLNMAILRGHFEIAFYLIEKGADVNVKDSEDNTALHMLLPFLKVQVKFWHNEINLKLAQFLVEKGAQVDVANKKGDIPLVVAISMHEPKFVDLFLSTSVDVNTILNLKPKSTFLHIAVSPPFMFHPWKLNNLDTKDYWMRRLSIVQSLLNKGADVNKQSGDGRSSLHFAAESGCVKFVKLLLASKVEINKVSANGKVPLHYAACNGNFNVISLLLKANAKVNIADNVGSTPLEFGIMENANFGCDTTKLLIDYGADIYHHCICIFNGLKIYDVLVAMMRTDLIKLFWSEGYPYDSTIFLPVKDCVESVQSFFQNIGIENIISLDFKKRLNNKNNRKHMEEIMNAQSKFVEGVEKNNVKLVLNAIEKGAEAGGSSAKIPFPLQFLAKKGFIDVAKVLLSNGVKPNTVDNEGNIPIELAVEFGHFKMYVTLLRYGACYNRSGFDTQMLQQQGNSQHYMLYLTIKKAFKSVMQGDHRILKKLNKYVKLKKWDILFALINCVNERGLTLMASAVERGDKTIVQTLMEFRLQALENDT